MMYYTHAGLFHCDEVTGYAICRLAGVCDDFKRLTSTDEESLPTDGLIADIGRKYDPSALRFDHHQGFLLREDGYPYASAGLLWKEFGMRIIEKHFGEENKELIWKRVDDRLIKGIDAGDSDNAYSLVGSCCAGEVNVVCLAMIVGGMNGSDVMDHHRQNVCFESAVNLVHQILVKNIESASKFYHDMNRFDDLITVEGKIAVLSEVCAWKEIVHERHPELEFVILPSSHPGNPVSMLSVPVKPNSRELKRNIERPEWFKGFIHQGKWIAGGSSVEEMKNLAQFNIS